MLPTPGHTKGSVTFATEVDGVPTAFCGDLVAEPGHVHTIHDLQWQYGLPDAAGAALHSVTLLAGLPAFGVRTSPERAYDPGQGPLAARPTRAR